METVLSQALILISFIQVKIIGVEPCDANAMALSLHHGQRVMLDHVGGFADGVAVKVVGEETFRLCRDLIDGIVLVSRDAICASIKVSLFLITFSFIFLKQNWKFHGCMWMFPFLYGALKA